MPPIASVWLNTSILFFVRVDRNLNQGGTSRLVEFNLLRACPDEHLWTVRNAWYPF